MKPWWIQLTMWPAGPPCPQCGEQDHHPEDLKEGWCWRCIAYTLRSLRSKK